MKGSIHDRIIIDLRKLSSLYRSSEDISRKIIELEKQLNGIKTSVEAIEKDIATIGILHPENPEKQKKAEEYNNRLCAEKEELIQKSVAHSDSYKIPEDSLVGILESLKKSLEK